MCAHDGVAMGHGPATYFPQHQQQLYAAPAPMPTSGRRVTGTPKERAQSGRWTHEEHLLFLQGLELHGKDWKKISKMIKTRSLVQIRSHAQKYHLKQKQFAQLHGVTPEETDCHLLMDGKRMATGCGSKQKKKKGKDAAKRRLPIVHLSGPNATIHDLPLALPQQQIAPSASAPGFEQRPPQLRRALTTHEVYQVCPQPQPEPLLSRYQQLQLQQQQQQQQHAAPLITTAATFYCDAAMLSDSGCTTDGDACSSSCCSSTTASGASTPSLHASLSFDQAAAAAGPHHAAAGSTLYGAADAYSSSLSSSSSSATTSASPSVGGDDTEEDRYQDLSLAAYEDEEEELDGAVVGHDDEAGQLARLFTSPDELEAFLTGVLDDDAAPPAPAVLAQQQQHQHQPPSQQQLHLQPAPQPLVVRRPCSSLDTAAVLSGEAFVPEHQHRLQHAQAPGQQQHEQAAAEAFALPHTPSYSEVVGHQQQGGPCFPEPEPAAEAEEYHQAPAVIYTTQQHLYQQQQQQGGWMVGSL